MTLVVTASYFAIFVTMFLELTGLGRVEADGAYAPAAGMSLLLCGIAVRWSAIHTLGRYFTPNVAILDGHRVVRRGIYRYVRHPSYAGSLMAFVGLALALTNWLVIPAALLPLLAAYLYRIGVEERALREALGGEYLDYAQGTKKLIPGVF